MIFAEQSIWRPGIQRDTYNGKFELTSAFNLLDPLCATEHGNFIPNLREQFVYSKQITPKDLGKD